MREKIFEKIEERFEEMVAIRRELHQIPEVSFKEEKTAQYILDFYKGKDVKIDCNIGGHHGILVTINPDKSDHALALRADFDALPIQEETDVEYKSKHEGVMHACGHDGHTAYLLVLADILIELKDEIPGTIKIIHQHAEETPPGGAIDFINSGLLDDVDRIYGLHINPIGPVGTIIYSEKEMMAGSGIYKLEIVGKGSHGSTPELGNDAIVAGAYFITAVQTIISRRLGAQEAGVITFGSFDGKGAANVIKESVTLEASLRYFDLKVLDKMVEELNRLAKGLEAMFGVEVNHQFIKGYLPTVNNVEIMEKAKNIFEKADYVTHLYKAPASMGSEDFSFYLDKIPGAYYVVGGSPEGLIYKYMNHNPKFNFDEGALKIAAMSLADLVLDYFNK